MSKRESIANNIVTTLNNVLQIRKVTREPIDFDKLSNAQFPAVLVRTDSEIRQDATIGATDVLREATVTYVLAGYTKTKPIDTARNNLIELIEEALDVDRTRGGHALDTQVTSVEVDDGSIDPIGGVLITIEIPYNFTRGAT